MMIKNITLGIKSYKNSFSLISKLKLWKYFAIPMVISLATAIAIFSAAYTLSDNLGEFISEIWLWEWGKQTFIAINTFLGGVIILVIGLILFKHTIIALSAPFMSPVSEKIETHLTGQSHDHYRNTTFLEQLSRGISISVRNLLLELLLSIPLLLLKFIPIVNLLSTVLLFIVQAYYAGFGNMDYTLERHFKYKESLAFINKNKGLAIGNGLIFMMLLFFPFIGVILVLPLSVTAASLVTVERLQSNKNPLVKPASSHKKNR